jgi:hypothetical protein
MEQVNTRKGKGQISRGNLLPGKRPGAEPDEIEPDRVEPDGSEPHRNNPEENATEENGSGRGQPEDVSLGEEGDNPE